MDPKNLDDFGFRIPNFLRELKLAFQKKLTLENTKNVDILVENILTQLENSPIILNGLLDKIPKERISERRVEGKWSIHEQVCHLVWAQDILMNRFRQFYNERIPHIKNHDPKAIKGDDFFARMNFEYSLTRFPEIRDDLLEMLRNYPEDYWELEGSHDSFEPYSTQLLIIHTLNVDFAHFFSIEQLGLTKEGMEKGILTVP